VLSRRDFLALATYSSVPIKDRISVRRETHGITIALSDELQWRITPSLFGKRTRLHVQEFGDGVRVALTDAAYAGTAINASFRATIYRSWPSWLLRIEHDAWSEPAEVDFAAWLAGRTTLSGRPRTLPYSSALIMRDATKWNLEPDFRMGWGSSEITIPNGSCLLANSGGIEPLDPNSRYLEATQAGSRVWLDRGEAQWKLKPTWRLPEGWCVDWTPESYAKASIEFVEERKAWSLLLNNPDGSGQAHLRPPKSVTNSDFGLVAPRWATAVDDRRIETWFQADWHPGTTHLNLPQAAFELTSSSVPLEVIAHDDETAIISVPLQLSSWSTLLGDEALQTRLIPTGRSPLGLAVTDTEPGEREFSCWIQMDEKGHAYCIEVGNQILEVIRPSDQMHLKISFQNFNIVDRLSGPQLEPKNEAEPSYLIFQLPPQSFLEQFFAKQSSSCSSGPQTMPQTPAMEQSSPGCTPDPGEPLQSPPVKTLMSGPSRIVFKFGPRHHDKDPRIQIPLRLEHLLDWGKFTLSLDSRAVRAGARPEGTFSISEVGANQTMIEAPYRLHLSPNEDGSFASSSPGSAAPLPSECAVLPQAPRTATEWNELWNAQLSGLGGTPPTLRALYTPGYTADSLPDPDQTPFLAPIDQRDRVQIVDLTSNFQMIDPRADPGNSCAPFLAQPVTANSFLLTAHGASFDIGGKWNPPFKGATPLDLEEWSHVLEQGSDDKVCEIYRGFLLPFGLRAVLFKRSFRELGPRSSDEPNAAVAYGRQTYEIKYRDQDEISPDGKRTLLRFPGPGQVYQDGQALGPRAWPYQYVSIERSFKTPILDFPSNPLHFWPTVGCKDFLFPATLVDISGHEIPIRIPMYYISVSVAYPPDCGKATLNCAGQHATQTPKCSGITTFDLASAIQEYNGNSNRNTITIGNTVSYAPSRVTGDTTYETSSQILRVDLAQFTPAKDSKDDKPSLQCLDFFRLNKLPAYPSIGSANIRIPAVEQLTGITNSVQTSYFDTYLQSGFVTGTNSGEIYFQFANGIPMQFSGPSGNNMANQSGGVITPNAALVGLSRKSGPVGGSTNGASSGATKQSLTFSATGNFDPSEYFRGAIEAARLLGGVLLKDVIQAVTGDVLGSLGGAPRILRRLYSSGSDVFLTAASNAQIALKPIQDIPGVGSRFQPLFMQLDTDLAKLKDFKEPLGDDLTVDQIRMIEQNIETQQRVVQDFSSVVSTAQALARNPGQLAETELESWLAVLEGQLLNQTQVGPQTPIGQLLTLLSAIISNPTQVSAALTILATNVINQLADQSIGLVSPVARRGLQAGIKAAQQAIQQFNDAGGQALLTNTALTIEKGLTLAGTVMQAVDTARCNARLITDFIELAINNQQTFVGALLDATGLNQTALNSALSQTGILAWRAEAESAYQGVLDLLSDQATITQLTRIWIRLRDVHEKIEQELDNLRAAVTHGEIVIDQSAASLGRLQALQRDFAAAILEFNAFVKQLPQTPGLASSAFVLRIDAAGAANWQAITSLTDAITALRQSLLEGLQRFAGATAASAANIKAALNNLYNSLTLSGPAIGQAQRIANAFNTYQSSFSTALSALPAITPDAIPQLVDLVYAATDISGFFSLAAEIISIANDKLTQIKTARDQLNAAVAQAAEVAGQAKNLFDQLHMAAAAAPVVLRQALLTEVEKASDAVNAAVQQQVHMLYDDAVASLAGALMSMSTSLSDLLNQVQPTIDNLLTLLNVASQVRDQLTTLLSVRTLEISFAWTPNVKAGPGDLGIFEPRSDDDIDPDEDANLPHCQIDSRIRVSIPSGNRNIRIVGTLRRFKLNLLAKSNLFLTVDFRSVQFTSINGSSPDCKVVIRTVKFGQNLAFLETVQNFLNPKSGPFVELQDNAILAGYRFALPNINTGGMIFRDARLSFSIGIPFDGEPVRFLFGLSDRANPFIVAASLLGGGGWFALGIGADGVDLIDIGIEIGLAGAVGIGPLSAYGRLMVGIYFTKDAQIGTTLGGFVDAFGQVSVIGISIVVYANMTLYYRESPDRKTKTAHGEVDVGIEISLWLVSFEIHFRYARDFSVSSASQPALLSQSLAAGNDPAPTGDNTSVVGELDWIAYDEALMDA